MVNHFDWLDRLTADEISHRLSRRVTSAVYDPYPEQPYFRQFYNEPPRPAAVLIPLLRQNQRLEVLFTRRNTALPEHSGQVAFPGGRCDPDDPDPQSAALREAQEEIGLQAQDVRILGSLGEFMTVTNYRVTPVVGQIPWPYLLRLAEIEVSRAFTIPLTWLADPANREVRLRELPAPYPPAGVIYFKEYDGEILWGASARFTLALIQALETDG